MISIWGTGTDNVDLRAAQRLGITVTNTPGVSAASVAEHALALMLAVARRIPAQDQGVREGRWPRGASLELYGKTLGIVGLGAIGQRLAAIARGIGMHVIAWTIDPDPGLGFELVEMDELLSRSDVVSLHVRLSSLTEKMVSHRELGLMKPSAILVNTARGPVVDQEALIEALSAGRICGAGLDVFAEEPLPTGNPLSKLTNVVLTPHSAGITPEALDAGLQLAVENVRSFSSLGTPRNIVPPACLSRRLFAEAIAGLRASQGEVIRGTIPVRSRFCSPPLPFPFRKAVFHIG